MKKGMMFGAVLLIGVLLGVGGYCLVLHLQTSASSQQPQPAAPAVTRADLVELRSHMAGIEARLAKVEARPGFNEALDDPALRERLAAVVVETRNPGAYTPRPVAPRSETWRKDAAARVRSDYARVLDDARKATKAEPARWKELSPVFDLHFAPVETALKDYEAGKSSAAPRVNDLVAPSLPGTLDALKAAMAAGEWQTFEAWRRMPSETPFWGASKGDFFLAGEERSALRAKEAAALHWQVLKGELSGFAKRSGLDEAQGKTLETAVRGHLERLFDSLRGEEQFNLMNPVNQEKAKTVAKGTEAEIAKALGAERLAKFKEWLASPGSRAAVYFGEIPKAALPGPGPGTPGPALQPGQAPGAGGKF